MQVGPVSEYLRLGGDPMRMITEGDKKAVCSPRAPYRMDVAISGALGRVHGSAPRPHLHRAWIHCFHICSGTGCELECEEGWGVSSGTVGWADCPSMLTVDSRG